MGSRFFSTSMYYIGIDNTVPILQVNQKGKINLT